MDNQDAAVKDVSLLKSKDLKKAWLIWMYYFQSCYNYERMQGIGFLQFNVACH